MNKLVSLDEAIRLINAGASLSIAGSAKALRLLPAGNWIGGTTHYFAGPSGGAKTDSQVFVTDLGAHGQVTIKTYRSDEVEQISTDVPETGFAVMIIPAGSPSLEKFAHRPYTQDQFLKALVGWVAGVNLDEIHTSHPEVIDGRSLKIERDGVVVAHVTLPAEKLASISIINPYTASKTKALRFEKSGFEATHCLVDGKRESLVDFLIKEGAYHGERPLVGDYAGAQINVSIRSVECVAGKVEFYAPVFPDTDYYLAEKAPNIEQALREAIADKAGAHVAFSCNCILNYLYGNLEGKKLGDLQGPVTFGEIGYQLLNQTLVVLEIH